MTKNRQQLRRVPRLKSPGRTFRPCSIQRCIVEAPDKSTDSTSITFRPRRELTEHSHHSHVGAEGFLDAYLGADCSNFLSSKETRWSMYTAVKLPSSPISSADAFPPG